MKNSGLKISITLAALLSTTCVHAEATSTDLLKYSTLGIWASTPLGVSARVGLAIPINKQSAFTIGNEFGLYGNKQFVGMRLIAEGHGVIWGSVDLAHWKTRSHPLLADKQTDYYGVEAQLAIFRAGLMFPSGKGKDPRLTFGTGFSF